MNKSQISTLKKEYTGQRTFSARENGYTLDVLSDEWKVGYKNTLRLGWMNELNVDAATFLDLRLVLAYSASRLASSTLLTYVTTLKTITNYLDINEFNAWWLTLDSYKKSVRSALALFCKCRDEYHSATLSPLYDSIKESNLGSSNRTKGILDIKIGAYSEIEHDNILEELRIETLQALNGDIFTPHKFTRLRNVIASQLMVAIVRRPCQLKQIKWCDVLRIGQEFQSHKEPDRYWQPITQHLFSDVEQLHLRTFKGKNGKFRFNAESRSHRLEPDFSLMLLRYYHVYESYLLHHLHKSNITLSSDETTELMRRSPLLPDQSLLHSYYQSKSDIFMAISDTSEAYHMKSDAITNSVSYLFKTKLNAQSDRLPSNPLALSNNRWRHTQLTQAVRQGFSPAQVASITGVTIEAITPYVDLKARERVKIDQAYADNHIIKRFDTVSVKELLNEKAFCIKSQFDEEMGYKLNPENCSSCKSKGGAPMGCYPCDNFRPLETANHQQYLNKAQRKLEINSQSGHPSTVKRLKKIIIYIKATIVLCEERKTLKLGGQK
jgi:hypothetical protein